MLAERISVCLEDSERYLRVQLASPKPEECSPCGFLCALQNASDFYMCRLKIRCWRSAPWIPMWFADRERFPRVPLANLEPEECSSSESLCALQIASDLSLCHS